MGVTIGNAIENIQSSEQHAMKLEKSASELNTMSNEITLLKNQLENVSSSSTRAQKLVQLTQNLSSQDDIDSLFVHVMQDACDLMDADRATLFLIDKGKKQLYSKVALGEKTITIPMSKGIVGHVYTTCSTVNIKNAYDDDRFDRSFDKASGYNTKSVLCMPIIDKQGRECVGVIQILNKLKPFDKMVFTKEDEALLSAFCSHIAVAASTCISTIDSKKTIKETINDLKSLEQEFDMFKRHKHDEDSKKKDILKFAKHLCDAQKINDIIFKVVEKSKLITNAERATLFIADHENGILWSKFADKENRIEVPLHAGIVGSVITTRRPKKIDDCYTDGDFNHAIDHKTGYHTKSMICIPIFDVNQKVIAALQVINKQNKSEEENDNSKLVFFDSDLELLKELGEHVSMAIIQSLTFHTKETEIERTVSQLQSLEKELEMIRLSEKTNIKRNQHMIDMTSKLMLHREVETIFGEVMENTRKLISADRATLFLLDAENKELYSHISKNVSEIRIPLSRGLVGHCATHKEVIIIPDAYQDHRFDRDIDFLKVKFKEQ